MKCPICQTDLVERYKHGCSYGTEESFYEWEKCCLYSERLAFGSTEINIGDFMTGFHYTDSLDSRESLFEKIAQVGKLYNADMKGQGT